MKQDAVFLHALGMVNALGGTVDEIAGALRDGVSPGMGHAPADGGEAFAGRVLTALDSAPPDALAHFDCRNNRLLLAALAQVSSAVEAAVARYGAARVG
ncbi:beta-ketoacyl-[acyl-carrier-protein] synthase II, partial [Paraburkholderia sp. Se-20369]|nr:beta-ketoacyl-[acyl-carrier-protein] synthase II [Paraburkholderia sp. Se-20369]